MFPVSDVIPSRRMPIVTIGLILVNVLVAAGAAGIGSAVLAEPAHDGTGTIAWSVALRGVFVHLGWLPAGTSLLCLWIFGDNIEGAMGRGPFLVFYLTAGLLGVAAHAASGPEAGGLAPAGSAPIAAIMAAYFVLYPRSRVLMLVFLILQVDVIEIPAVLVAGFWVLLHLMAGMAAIGHGMPSAAVFGPLFAGGAAGTLAGLMLRRRVRWP